jgi:8-amino-7-oxononanoate synthase
MQLHLSFLKSELDKRQQQQALRKLQDNSEMIDFSSNDYLGMAHSIQLKELIHKNSIYINKNGATGSRLLSGNYKATEDLEIFIADYHHSEKALLYNSGYDANVGLFSSILKRGDYVLYDEFIHASVRDGIRLGFANAFSFKHNDLNDLERLLNNSAGKIYVAVEAVYSMDGDMAPLKKISQLCEKHNAALIVDEAHSAGIYGNAGEGLCNQLNIQDKIFARLVTYGKAFGVHGAAIIGSSVLCDFLINFSRSFIYTTALPPHAVLAIQSAYTIMQQEHEQLVENLFNNIELFKKSAAALKLPLGHDFDTAIQTVILPGNENVKKAATKLQEHNFDVRPILSPTVPQGKERLRIILHSYNTTVDIEKLVTFLHSNT